MGKAPASMRPDRPRIKGSARRPAAPDDDASNWELVCQKCNTIKGCESLDEFFGRQVNARAFREWLAVQANSELELIAA
jgi:hypothetical protein